MWRMEIEKGEREEEVFRVETPKFNLIDKFGSVFLIALENMCNLG